MGPIWIIFYFLVNFLCNHTIEYTLYFIFHSCNCHSSYVYSYVCFLLEVGTCTPCLVERGTEAMEAEAREEMSCYRNFGEVMKIKKSIPNMMKP